MMTTIDLQSQLLCASNAAYGIDPVGKFNPLEPYYSAIGFIAPPIAFVAGDDDIDACFVGTTPQGVILAFRGTIAPDIHNVQSLLDWINDLTDNPISAPGISGKVHEGFWNAVDVLWEPMVKEIRKQMNVNGKTLPLYVTGHSKGGAMSSLAAIRLKLEARIMSTAVYTYAAAHPGNSTFADQYQQIIPNHIRYEYGNDIVPHLVPDAAFIDAMAVMPEIGKFFAGMEKWDYRPAGKLQFIKWDKKTVVDKSVEINVERTAKLVAAVLECQFEAIVDAHTSGCKGGYMTAIYPTLCSASLIQAEGRVPGVKTSTELPVVRLSKTKS